MGGKNRRNGLSPVDVPLSPLGGPVSYAGGEFDRTTPIPLKLELRCGRLVLGSALLDPKPEIVELIHEVLGPQPLVGINAAGTGPDDPFFTCGELRCDFGLLATNLQSGTFVIHVRMPDGRVYGAGFRVR